MTVLVALFTVNVKLCKAGDPIAFEAVNVIMNTPVAVGVPLSVPVPLWLSTNTTPFGSAPASVIPAVGNALVVTVNDPADPKAKLALFPLVMAGAWFTVSVKVCVALGVKPFCAVKLRM